MASALEPKAFSNVNAFKAIAPNDLLTMAAQTGHHATSLYVGVGGDLSIVGMDGVTALFKNVPSGTLLPVHAKTVNSAGTTATNIIALFRV